MQFIMAKKLKCKFIYKRTVIKMGEIWGRNQIDKNGYFLIFLHKIICCGCVLESPHRGDSNTHPKHMILWRIYDNLGKNTGLL